MKAGKVPPLVLSEAQCPSSAPSCWLGSQGALLSGRVHDTEVFVIGRAMGKYPHVYKFSFLKGVLWGLGLRLQGWQRLLAVILLGEWPGLQCRRKLFLKKRTPLQAICNHAVSGLYSRLPFARLFTAPPRLHFNCQESSYSSAQKINQHMWDLWGNFEKCVL